MKKDNAVSSFQNLLRRITEFKVSLHVAVVLCVLIGVVIGGVTFYSLKVAVGEVRVIGVGVGIYWDSICDNPVSSLSWGKITVNPLTPQTSKNITLYIKNEGSNPAVILLNASGWSPPDVEKYISLDWDYDGRVLGVDEKDRVTLVLSIESSIWNESPRINNYNFTIKISTGSS